MASLELTPDVTSPSRARAFTRQLLGEWHIASHITEDAELLVTELVTNAVVHAATPVTVEISRENRVLRFIVSDGARGSIPLRVPVAEAVTGRGVYLLDRISDDWRVVETDEGKSVLFELVVAATGMADDTG